MCNRQGLLHNCQDTVQNENGDLLVTKLAKSILLAFANCLKTCDLELPSPGRTETSQPQPTTGCMGFMPNPICPHTGPCWQWRQQSGCWERQGSRYLSTCPAETGKEQTAGPLTWNKAPSPWHIFHCPIGLDLWSINSKIKLLRFQDSNCRELNFKCLHWSHTQEAGSGNRGWSKPRTHGLIRSWQMRSDWVNENGYSGTGKSSFPYLSLLWWAAKGKQMRFNQICNESQAFWEVPQIALFSFSYYWWHLINSFAVPA